MIDSDSDGKKGYDNRALFSLGCIMHHNTKYCEGKKICLELNGCLEFHFWYEVKISFY